MASALTVSESTKTRGREQAGWAGSLGNVATTRRWNGGSARDIHQHTAQHTLCIGVEARTPKCARWGHGHGEGVSSGCRLNSHSYWTRVGMEGRDKCTVPVPYLGQNYLG